MKKKIITGLVFGLLFSFVAPICAMKKEISSKEVREFWKKKGLLK